MDEFINLKQDNIFEEPLCCIVRLKTKHPGVEEKRKWLNERIKDGHIYRKLNAKATVFIEYAPLEKAWVPIKGDNYYYIYCLWVESKYKGMEYGKKLMEYCINDAKRNHKSGICMLGSTKQKNWLSDQSFSMKYGFVNVDSTNNGYNLLALSFDGTNPKFMDNAKKEEIENQELTIYYSMQCPFIYQTIELIKKYCSDNNIDVSLNNINTLYKAKQLPCVFNNFAVFYKGKFETVNLLDLTSLEKILSK